MSVWLAASRINRLARRMLGENSAGSIASAGPSNQLSFSVHGTLGQVVAAQHDIPVVIL